MGNCWVKLYRHFVSFAGVRTSGRSAVVPWCMPPPQKNSISFSKGCRSAAVSENINNRSNSSDNIPLLMLPPQKDSISFFNLSKGLSCQVDLPKADLGRFFSSRGWLIKHQPPRMTLLHPFSSVKLELPPIRALEATWYDWIPDEEEADSATFMITKCVLSSSNPDSHTKVLLIFGRYGKLAYARPCDQVWRNIKTSNTCRYFVDAIYYQNQFYAINALGQIFSIKDDDHDNTVLQVAQLPTEFVDHQEVVEYLYMVESDDGALLVVSRRGGQLQPDNKDETSVGTSYRTLRFHVFEVNLRTDTWTKIMNLGNQSLFLGLNSSLSTDASKISKCKTNCIYFTDDSVDCYWYLDDKEHIQEGGKDMGIYNMDDGRIEPLLEVIPCNRFNPLMWVEQSS